MTVPVSPRPTVVVGLVALVVAAALLVLVLTNRASAPIVPVSAAPVPVFGHVYLIVLENKSPTEILSSGEAPYLSSLASSSTLATNYHAVAHPSQPNYLALFSGSTQGISDDHAHQVTAPTIVDELEAHGKSWAVYEENYPGGCFDGELSNDGRDGPGTYARKHNPAITFTTIRDRPDRCKNILDFTTFDPAAHDFSFIAPNLCHDMHDCSVAQGDAFLKEFVPRILDSDAWKEDGVLFITFDESDRRGEPNDSTEEASNEVTTLIASPLARAAFASATNYDHYSLLRTIEASWNLGCLAEDCGAADMADVFATP